MSDAPPPARRYEYRSVDRSLVTPWLRARLWGPLLPWIPARVTPNAVTAWGNVCSATAFAVLMLRPGAGGAPALVVGALALFLYLSLDNLDGMHAKRTGQSSARGELLDHWSDGLSLGLALLACARVVQLPPGLTLAFLALGTASYFATMWEQRRTGILQLGTAGATEALLLLAGLYLAMAGGAEAWLTRPLAWAGWSPLVLVAAGACVGLATAPWEAWTRVRRGLGDWVPLVVTTGLTVAWWIRSDAPLAAVAALLALFPGVFGGAQQIAHLTGVPPRRWEPVILGGVAAGLVGALVGAGVRDEQAWLAWGLVAYAVARLGWDVTRAERTLRLGR